MSASICMYVYVWQRLGHVKECNYCMYHCIHIAHLTKCVCVLKEFKDVSEVFLLTPRIMPLLVDCPHCKEQELNFAWH